ncbi:MAG: fasciclin domain-containing protein [Ferruginibacter sp.]
MKVPFSATLGKSFMFLAFAGLALVSCKDDDVPPVNQQGTITAQVSAGTNFTSLKAAVVKAGLAATLDGTGPFTVFAPTDDAFTASGVTADVVNSLSADQLKTILLYHTIPSKIAAADVPAGPNAKVITASGDSVFVTNNASGVFVNGIKVTAADLPASNGVIHTVGKVLLPPGGNIVQVASADTALTYLVAAVVRASTGTTNVAAILSGTGILTVFAPTNNAFRAAGFPTIAAINAADPNTLTTILTYHVVPGRVFSSDLTNGAQPVTANGGKVTIGLAGTGATVKGNTNTGASNIVATNIMASNGVVHVIDQVLLP